MNAADRQRPPPGELYLDHVSHFVADLDAAARVCEALGLRVTPTSVQRTPEGPVGASNRCVMLDAGYIELLSPTHDTPAAARMRALMRRYDGVHLVCFGTPDAAGEQRRLAARAPRWRSCSARRPRRRRSPVTRSAVVSRKSSSRVVGKQASPYRRAARAMRPDSPPPSGACGSSVRIRPPQEEGSCASQNWRLPPPSSLAPPRPARRRSRSASSPATPGSTATSGRTWSARYAFT